MVVYASVNLQNYSQTRGTGRRSASPDADSFPVAETRNIRRPSSSSSSVVGGIPPLGRSLQNFFYWSSYYFLSLCLSQFLFLIVTTGQFLLLNHLVIRHFLHHCLFHLLLRCLWFLCLVCGSCRTERNLHVGIQKRWVLEIWQWWAFRRCASCFKCFGEYAVGQKSSKFDLILEVTFGYFFSRLKFAWIFLFYVTTICIHLKPCAEGFWCSIPLFHL